jgi:pyruvate-ferredoxin/flavodoxin oxidoreductase
VPFALASAFRDLEALTGRHRDALRRSPPGQGAEAMLMLVGLGRLGARLLAEVPRVRALGHDVGAVTLTAMRPFPGARAVRFLARAHAVTVLEHTDEALAQSNAVTRELKAAFVDALTWAPDYPGIGRVPRVHSGVLRSVTRELEAEDVDAIVRNMLAGDGGRRFFVLGGEPTFGLDTAEHVTRRAATMR